jgi:LemA protein
MKKPKLSRASIILISIAAFIIILFGYVMSTRNSLVSKEESVKSSWSQVLNQYQRRYDLIPNLVATVQGYAEHENETFRQVTEARAAATSFQITPEVLNNPQAFQKFQTLQGDINAALSRLLAVSENYPQLKASENFLELQSQLEGTENRISVERKTFNDTAKNYNVYLKSFPKNIVASMFNFEEKAYFNVTNDNALQAPTVDFKGTK